MAYFFPTIFYLEVVIMPQETAKIIQGDPTHPDPAVPSSTVLHDL